MITDKDQGSATTCWLGAADRLNVGLYERLPMYDRIKEMVLNSIERNCLFKLGETW